jgi:putative ABC transport system substrate-binding protein
LVRLKVDVIVTQGPAVLGARAMTGSIPVVFGFSGDPVEAKLVESLGRPGGNLTGLSLLALELVGKRLELLKEALPGLTRVAILANPSHPGEQAELKASQTAASRLGLTVQYLPVRAVSDFDAAFDAIARERAEAIVAFPDALMMRQAKAIAAFAAKRRIPAVSGWAQFVVDGNLMTYGPNLEESYRYIATHYVDRILRGAKPADLPVEQPTKFELVINLKTAKALGLTIPQSILLRVDEVIE